MMKKITGAMTILLLGGLALGSSLRQSQGIPLTTEKMQLRGGFCGDDPSDCTSYNDSGCDQQPGCGRDSDCSWGSWVCNDSESNWWCKPNNPGNWGWACVVRPNHTCFGVTMVLEYCDAEWPYYGHCYTSDFLDQDCSNTVTWCWY